MRLLDREWPPWHPLKELKAEHLLGLEDYLLSHAVIAGENAHGVDYFDWRVGLSLSADTEGVRAAVSRLQGLTPAGEPVWLRSDERLEVSVAPRDARTAVPKLTDEVCDVWVDVNRRGIAPSGDGAHVDVVHPAKLALRVGYVDRRDDDFPLKPIEEPHSLYLGRYRVVPRGDHELMHPPMMRRLGGLEPWDKIWHEWVRPLRSRIDTLMTQAESAPPTSAKGISFLMALTRLAFVWPSLPLPALARELRFVRWLATRDTAPAHETDLRHALATLPDTVSSGRDVPHALAALLPEEAVKAERATNLPEVFGKLLHAIGDRGIDYFAPTELFERWVNELRRIRTTKGSFDPPSLAAQLDQEIRSAGDGSMASGLWFQAVVALTLSTLETATGTSAPLLVASQVCGLRGDVSAEAARVLAALYTGEASAHQAGPAAYHWLAHSATNLPEVLRACRGEAASYLSRLANGVDIRQGDPRVSRTGVAPSAPGKADRILTYLAVRQTTTAPLTAVDTYCWHEIDTKRPAPSRRTASVPPDALVVTVLGSTGVGKSTLVEHLPYALERPLGRLVPIRLNRGAEATDTDADRAVVQGTVSIAGRELALRISEVDLAHADIERLRASHLVVFVVEPSLLAGDGAASRELDALASAADRLVRRHTSCLRAIAYTKADQYGVTAPKSLRMVGAAEADRFRAWIERGDRQDWERFVAAGESAGGNVTRQGGATIGVKRPPRAADEWSVTRALMLDRSRALWEAVVRLGEPHAFLNGYAVSAKPADVLLQPLEHRGTLQLLADFVSSVDRVST